MKTNGVVLPSNSTRTDPLRCHRVHINEAHYGGGFYLTRTEAIFEKKAKGRNKEGDTVS